MRKTKERRIDRIVGKYLKDKYSKDGWKIPESFKNKKDNAIGIDWSAYNQKKGAWVGVEVKRCSRKAQENHTNFYSFFGQLLSRIKEFPKPNYQKRRRYVIAGPKKFVEFIHQKIHYVGMRLGERHGMKGGWKLFGRAVNLRVWSIYKKYKKGVKEYHWKDLLKEKLE